MIAYYGNRISDNIIVTPPIGQVGQPGDANFHPGIPGYLICKDVVIARTGFQRYRVGDLKQDEAERLGVDTSNQMAFIDLFRPEKEVYDPATLASFEGMPVTDSHPDEFVGRDTWREVACGHVQNVRRRAAPLDDGNLALIADLVINADPLATNVEQRRKRAVSCGYEYALGKDGDKILQTHIRGNHVAVVDEGRAGPEARIYDSADPTSAAYPPELTDADLWELDASDVQQHTSVSEFYKSLKERGYEFSDVTRMTLANVAAARKQVTKDELKPDGRPTQQKEKWKMKNPLAFLIGRGLRAMAADDTVDPEELAEAARAAHRATDSEESEEEKEAAKKAADKKAKDESEKEEEREAKLIEKMADKKAKDEAEAKEKAEKEAKDAADKAAADKRARDEAEANQHHMACKVKDCTDRDCRMHKSLDSILTKHPKEEGEDADMKELGELFQEFLAEEGQEPEHNEEGSEVIEPISENEPAHDASEEEVKKLEMQAAKDAADETAFLKRIRPTIARSKDTALIAEFNQRLARHQRKSKASDATYARVALAAGARKDAGPSGRNYDALQAAVDAKRGKTNLEVK